MNSPLYLYHTDWECVCFFCLPNASLMTLWLIFFLHIFVMFCAQCSQLNFMRIVAVMVVCIVFLSFCSFGYFCVLVIFILTHIVCEYVFCECKCQMCTATPKSMCLISISFVILIFQTRKKISSATKYASSTHQVHLNILFVNCDGSDHYNEIIFPWKMMCKWI